jgi:DNA mismatch repair protein MSH4
MLKSFVESAPQLFEILGGARSALLLEIRVNFRPENIEPTIQLIRDVINDDVAYQKTPLDLRNQRTYAVKVFNKDVESGKHTDGSIDWSQWTS